MGYGIGETALLVSAAAAVAGTGYSVVSGEQAASRQRKGMREQAAAQDAAEAAAARQERAAMAEQVKAAKSGPDIMGIYDREQRRGTVGPNLTNNAGPLTLGGNSLLGG